MTSYLTCSHNDLHLLKSIHIVWRCPHCCPQAHRPNKTRRKNPLPMLYRKGRTTVLNQCPRSFVLGTSDLKQKIYVHISIIINTYIHFQVSSVLQMLSAWLECFAQTMMSLIGRICSKFTETERKEVIQIIPARHSMDAQ